MSDRPAWMMEYEWDKVPDKYRAAVSRLTHRLECAYFDWREDGDGCVELMLQSGLDTHGGDYTAEDERREAEEVRAELDAAGFEVIEISGAAWFGWSEYTPDPGDARHAVVRLRGAE